MKLYFQKVLLLLLAYFLVGIGWTNGAIYNFKVTTDRTVNCSSLESIVADVFRLSGAKTDDEKVIALYEWLHNTIFHWQYPTESSPQTVGPLKVINVYGWSLCGGQHTVLKALYETAGYECRYVGWSNPGHTTIEVKYGGKWHYLDVFLKCYFWTKDKKTIASQEDIANDPSIVYDAVKEGRAARQHLCCGDTEQSVVSGCKSRKVVGDSKGWASVTWRDQNYSPKLILSVFATLRLEWASVTNGYAVKGKPPQHSCGIKDFVKDPVLGPIAEHYGPRNWSSGTFTYEPDFTKQKALMDIELLNAHCENGRLVADKPNGSAIFKMPLPYPYVNGKFETVYDGGDGKAFISIDGGKNWMPITNDNISDIIRQRYNVFMKVEFPSALKKFRFEGLIEHNRFAQPYLMNGTNVVTLNVDDKIPTGCILEVKYSLKYAFAKENRDRFDGKGIKYEDAGIGTLRVNKVPYSLNIPIGGNTPPKMNFIEYSVKWDKNTIQYENN